MGCEQIVTFDSIEDNENSNSPSQNNNLLIRQYTGLLSQDNTFSDTIIKSNDELNDNLRSFIPSKIKKDNNYTYNIYDDILTKSEKVNFQDEYIIAINGIHKVLRVEELNVKYLIFHDNQPKEKNSYVAIVVKRISGFNPEFTLASPKRPFKSEM